MRYTEKKQKRRLTEKVRNCVYVSVFERERERERVSEREIERKRENE